MGFTRRPLAPDAGLAPLATDSEASEPLSELRVVGRRRAVPSDEVAGDFDGDHFLPSLTVAAVGARSEVSASAVVTATGGRPSTNRARPYFRLVLTRFVTAAAVAIGSVDLVAGAELVVAGLAGWTRGGVLGGTVFGGVLGEVATRRRVECDMASGDTGWWVERDRWRGERRELYSSSVIMSSFRSAMAASRTSSRDAMLLMIRGLRAKNTIHKPETSI